MYLKVSCFLLEFSSPHPTIHTDSPFFISCRSLLSFSNVRTNLNAALPFTLSLLLSSKSSACLLMMLISSSGKLLLLAVSNSHFQSSGKTFELPTEPSFPLT